MNCAISQKRTPYPIAKCIDIITLVLWDKVGLWHGIFYTFCKFIVIILPHELCKIKNRSKSFFHIQISYFLPRNKFHSALLMEPWRFQICSITTSVMHRITQSQCGCHKTLLGFFHVFLGKLRPFLPQIKLF